MARILDWKRSEDTRDIVHVIVQALAEGRLVLAPSETTYWLLASGLSEPAVDALMKFPDRCMDRKPVLMLRSSSEINDYIPDIERVGHRIASRGWPGPLAIEFPINSDQSLYRRLPQSAQQQLAVNDHFVTLHVPAHQAIVEALQLLPGPVMAVPVKGPQAQPIIEATLSSTQSTYENLALIIDDGRTHFGGSPTVVRVCGHECSTRAVGVLDQNVLVGLGQLVVLLVCTGNTCRSPMAETLLKHQLGLRFKELFETGKPPPAVALSAGLSAYPGGAASPEAVTVMGSRGLNLKDHQSRPLTQRLLRQADLVLTMTNSHRNAIINRWPEATAKTYLLSRNGRDVADPFGGPVPLYAACADEIDAFLKNWVGSIDESWLPRWRAISNQAVA